MDPQAPNVPTITPEAASASQPSQSPKDNHGITILAMAVFVLLSLGAVAFLYQQNQQLKGMLAAYYQTPTPFPTPSSTPDVTASWKKYTNDKMLVSFRYPTENGLQIFASPTNDLDIAINKGQYDPLFFELVRLPNLTVQDWYPKAYASAKQDQTKPPELQSGPQIGGLNSVRADFNMEQSGKITFIFIQKGKDLYQINIPISGNETQYQILSTLKFSSASPSAVPSTTPVSTSSALPVMY